jgi:hypothetical protein
MPSSLTRRLLTVEIAQPGPNTSFAQLSIKSGSTQSESTSNIALATMVPTHRGCEFLARVLPNLRTSRHLDSKRPAPISKRCPAQPQLPRRLGLVPCASLQRRHYRPPLPFPRTSKNRRRLVHRNLTPLAVQHFDHLHEKPHRLSLRRTDAPALEGQQPERIHECLPDPRHPSLRLAKRLARSLPFRADF